MREEPLLSPSELTREQSLLLLGIVLLIVAAAWLFAPVLTPFLGGMLLAYVGAPLVDRLETGGIPRIFGALVVILVLLLLLLIILLVTLPLLIRELASFIARIPDVAAWLLSFIQPWFERLDLDEVRLEPERLRESLLANWQQVGSYTSRILFRVTQSGFALLVYVANLILIPVVAVYLMKDWNRFTHRLHGLLPVSMQPKAAQLATECDEMLGAFLRGQLMIMISLGVFYSTGLSLLGLDSAMVIGLISAIFALVPFLGTILGVGIATLSVLTQSGELSLLASVWGVYILGQVIEGYVLTPCWWEIVWDCTL